MNPVDVQMWLYDVSGSEDPRVHAQVVRVRARVPTVLSDNGDHHLRHHHVLRREEHTQHGVHQHTGGVLVHHRHHDHARVSDTLTPHHLTLAAPHGPPISRAELEFGKEASGGPWRTKMGPGACSWCSHLANGSEAARATVSLPFRPLPVTSWLSFRRTIPHYEVDT